SRLSSLWLSPGLALVTFKLLRCVFIRVLLAADPGAASRQLLSEAAVAISDNNHDTAASHLAALKRAANQHDDAEQQLIAMMVVALSSRIVPAASAPAQHLAELCGFEQRAGSRRERRLQESLTGAT
uniref:Uncharacterized protein n=1 Tax=Zea mays TaxID=4577 RepID=A0A804UJ77_MAIZE